MLTAYVRSALTGKLCQYKIEDVSVEDIPVVSEAIKNELGKEYQHPVLFSIECGKGSLKGQPEVVESA